MGSSTVSSARSLLELTWASNEGMTCGGWAPGEPTLARPTWLVGRPENPAKPPQTSPGGW